MHSIFDGHDKGTYGFRNLDFAFVNVIQQLCQLSRVNFVDTDENHGPVVHGSLGQAAFQNVPFEVQGSGAQHDFVGMELFGPHHDHHIRQLSVLQKESKFKFSRLFATKFVKFKSQRKNLTERIMSMD